ncbi:MAG TPA: hypothetical protein VN364_11665 [Bellilinea sp.]|nr:hypothetical protein [Bellilinea sp.]
MNRKNIIAAIWLIGLGILFMVNYVWPGILILIGLTMIVRATMGDEPSVIPPGTTPGDGSSRPQAEIIMPIDVTARAVDEKPEVIAYEPPVAGDGEPLPAVLATVGDQLFLAGKLPELCPACNAPLRENAEKLTWHGDNSVTCLFCGYRITVKAE